MKTLKPSVRKAVKLSVAKLAAERAKKKELADFHARVRAARIRKGEIPTLSYHGLPTYRKGDQVEFEKEVYTITMIGRTCIGLRHSIEPRLTAKISLKELSLLAKGKALARAAAAVVRKGIVREGYDSIEFRSKKAMRGLLG